MVWDEVRKVMGPDHSEPWRLCYFVDGNLKSVLSRQ